MQTDHAEAPGNFWDEACTWPSCRGRRRMQMRPPVTGQDLGPGTWECTLNPNSHCGYLWPKGLRQLGPLFGDHTPAPRVHWREGASYLIGRAVALRRRI